MWRDHDSSTSDSGGVLPTVPMRHGSWITKSRPAEQNAQRYIALPVCLAHVPHVPATDCGARPTDEEVGIRDWRSDEVNILSLIALAF